MEFSNRFADLWKRWDGSVRDRSEIPDYLAQATDEDLIELLAGAPVGERKYECDVVATEILNRLHRRNRALPDVADEVLRSAEAAYHAAAEGQRAIHTAESILKASGDEELGQSVSASAYASLDTTRLAFEAAQRNSSDVQAAVAQSRVARQLADDAETKARTAVDATQEARTALEQAGHPDAAAEARAAAERIADATQRTAGAVAEENDAADGTTPRRD